MTIIEDIKRRLGLGSPVQDEDAEPKAYTAGASGQGMDYFSPRERSDEQMRKWRTIQKQGGIVAEALDSYRLFILSNGYKIVGDDENLVNLVKEADDRIGFGRAMGEAIDEALVMGDAIQELVPTRKGDKLGAIITLDSSTIRFKHDMKGRISEYVQEVVVGNDKKTVSLKPNEVVKLTIFKTAGSVYGLSLIERAYDEILRDTRTSEGTSTAIERHGHPRHHIMVGTPEKQPPKKILEDIRKEIQELKPQHDYITNALVKVTELDTQGIPGVEMYNNISIDRLCTALGTPEELLGLGRGSTEATAKVRMTAWYDKIAALQQVVARAYNQQVIDRITGKPGAVKIVFNDVNPQDEKDRAEWITALMKANPLDPFSIVPRRYIQETFSIDPGQYEEKEEEDNLWIPGSQKKKQPTSPPPPGDNGDQDKDQGDQVKDGKDTI